MMTPQTVTLLICPVIRAPPKFAIVQTRNRGDSREADLERRQRGAEQFGAIADSRDGDSHVGDQQRDAVGIVRHKVARLPKAYSA